MHLPTLLFLPLLVYSSLLSPQSTDVSSPTEISSLLTTSTPTSVPAHLELRAQGPAPAPAPANPPAKVPPVPAPAAPVAPVAPVAPAPVAPVPAAPAGGAGGPGAGAPAGASPEGSQYPTITTCMINTVVGGVPKQVPIVYTQTFESVISQGPTPEGGTVGLGTLTGTVGAVRTGRAKI